MKLVTYNVNGIRAAIKKGLIDWIIEEDPDAVCIQETKAHPEQVPKEIFSDLGYNAYWHSAEKKGYSGVLTLSKTEASNVKEGMDMPQYDIEGRILRTDFGDWTLVNMYLPSSTSGKERHEYKMRFLDDFETWVKKLLKKRKNVIVVGDYNIVRLDIDIHNPQRKDFPPGFRPEERAWIQRLFQEEFVDAYRELHPDTEDQYSWWSYRAGARKNNKGWRIDYIALSNPLSSSIKSVRHGYEANHSDHVPVILSSTL